MITRDNLTEVLAQMSAKDKKRISNTTKEYCVIELHTFNVGSYTTVKLTNNYSKYANVSDSGNCILETNEVAKLISSK